MWSIALHLKIPPNSALLTPRVRQRSLVPILPVDGMSPLPGAWPRLSAGWLCLSSTPSLDSPAWTMLTSALEGNGPPAFQPGSPGDLLCNRTQEPYLAFWALGSSGAFWVTHWHAHE